MISTEELITELGDHLGVEISDNSEELSTSEALLLLNRSHWEILDKFPFREKEATLVIPTVIGIRSYVAPEPFEALRQISILNPTSNKFEVLDRETIFTHEDERADLSSVEDRGYPIKYLRESNKIRLKPVPDDAYTLTIKYWITLDELATDHDLELPKSWHEIVLLGAVWRGLLRQRDYISMKTVKDQQVALINSSTPTEAKEEFDSHRAGLEVLNREDINWR